MVVLDPLLVVLSGVADMTVAVPNFPFDPSRGTHFTKLQREIFIDRSDFRMEDSEVCCEYSWIVFHVGARITSD